MFKSRGRHARKRGEIWLPLWLGALLLALSAMREMEAATAAQLGEIARGGTL